MFECLSFSASFTLYYTHTRRQTLSLFRFVLHTYTQTDSLSLFRFVLHTYTQTDSLSFTLYYTHTRRQTLSLSRSRSLSTRAHSILHFCRQEAAMSYRFLLPSLIPSVTSADNRPRVKRQM